MVGNIWAEEMFVNNLDLQIPAKISSVDIFC